MFIKRKDSIPRFAIPVGILTADILIRHSSMSEWNIKAWGIYSLSFIFTFLVWNFLAFAAAALKRRSILIFFVVLSAPLFSLIFMYAGFYIPYKMLGMIPNYYAIDYIFMEPEHFRVILKAHVGLTGLGAMLFLTFVLSAVLWITAPKVASKPSVKTRYLRLATIAVFIADALILNNNLRFYDQSSLPEGNTALILTQIAVNKITGKKVGTYGLKSRLPITLSKINKKPVGNVLVIINEGLMWDQTSLYGNARRTTPFLDAFAARHPGEFFIFNYAECNATSTDISVTGLAAGMSPAESGSRWHSAPIIFEYAKTLDLDTFYFASHSFKWANLDNFFSSPTIDVMFNRETSGLKSYNDLGIDDAETAKAWLKYMEKRGAGSNRFVGFFHVNGTHEPYRHPKEFHIWDGGLLDRYDDAVLYLDYNFNGIWTYLEKSGIINDTVIIFTSDHNESLKKDHIRGHFSGFYESQTHVPFWIFVPKAIQEQSPQWIDAIKANQKKAVSNIDILPTVLDFWGIYDDPTIASYRKYYQGSSVFRPIPDDRVIYILTQTDISNISGHPGMAILVGTKKYLIKYSNNRGEEYLFDLEKDPDEHNNLWQTLTEEQKNGYRALGYKYFNSKSLMKKLKIENPNK